MLDEMASNASGRSMKRLLDILNTFNANKRSYQARFCRQGEGSPYTAAVIERHPEPTLNSSHG
jgi:hypothetical protein